MLRSLFVRKPKSPARRKNGVRQAASPRRSPSPRRAHPSPRRSPSPRRAPPSPRRRNNNVMVVYNGKIMTYNNMQKAKEMKRRARAGYF